MRRQMRPVLAALALGLATAARADDPDEYLCIGEQVGGLRYDEQVGKWVLQDFNTSRYVLRHLKDQDFKYLKALGYEQKPWGWFEFGSEIPLIACDNIASLCTHGPASGTSFIFNQTTRRFEMDRNGSYINWTVEHHIFPQAIYIEVGSCSPF